MNYLVRDQDSTFERQLLNIPDAESKAVIEPDHIAENLGREAVPAEVARAVRQQRPGGE
jgi:hypothetical protein